MPGGDAPDIELTPSRLFAAWLHDQGVSLAFTTYDAGKLFLVGARDRTTLAVVERSFPRCMGLHAVPDGLLMSTAVQIWRLVDTPELERNLGDHDALYVPRLAYTTGDLDVHELAQESCGRLVFVNTLFSCLATVSDRYSFVPLWQPGFITRLAAEDRCHLSGLGLRDGRVRYVTAVSRTDVHDGWREHRTGGGVVIDVDSDEVVIEGLSMPHSPRWYRDRLWVLDSGTGVFGQVDLAGGRVEPVAFCPGYLRGLDFVGDYAVVGVSKAREAATFGSLPLASRLREEGLSPRCGLLIIDLRTGSVVHWLRIEGPVRELFGVTVLPEVRRPGLLGFKSDEVRWTLSVGPAGSLGARPGATGAG